MRILYQLIVIWKFSPVKWSNPGRVFAYLIERKATSFVVSDRFCYNSPNSTAVAAAAAAPSGGLVNKLFRKYPVITREMITEEEHREIVDCMTMQNIADEQAIIELVSFPFLFC